MKNKFEIGTKVIWDSGFGYDLGYYIGPSETMYYTHQFKMVTGNYYHLNDTMSVNPSELIEYNEGNYNQMVKKYNYQKNFPQKV